MDLDQARERLPLFITGGLSPEDSLAVSGWLAREPALMDELRLALALREALLQDSPEPPPFPKAVYAAGQRLPLMPAALSDSLRTLRQAADITGNALRIAFKFLD